jgi:hypothetical protein
MRRGSQIIGARDLNTLHSGAQRFQHMTHFRQTQAAGHSMVVHAPTRTSSFYEAAARHPKRETPTCYLSAQIGGGFQVPKPGGKIEGGVSLGQYRRITM